MARPKLIMGNWKMALSAREARDLAASLVEPAADMESGRGSIVLCPSTVHIEAVAGLLGGGGLGLGAQDCVPQPPGAVTGGTSVEQLAEFGVSWILVGHSERRAIFGEKDVLLAEKFAAVARAGIRPVLCVGETLVEREDGKTTGVIQSQLDGALPAKAPDSGCAIAYEPVWAIGTGRNARPEDVVEVHRAIRGHLGGRWGEAVAATTPILYGGSVNEANAADYLRESEVDGALVGGASLEAERFLAICQAVS